MTQARLHTGGDLLRRIDALLTPLADEYKVRLDSDRLRVRAVDPANVGMVDFNVPASGFETFDLPEETVIGLSHPDLSSIARYARKGGNSNDNPGDPVEWVFDSEERRSYVHVERDDLDRYTSFASIDPDSIRQEPDLPDLSLPWETNLDSGLLRDVTQAADSASCEYLQVAAENPTDAGVSDDVTAGVRLYGETDHREEVFRPDTTATFVGDGDPEEAASLFSLDYLKQIARYLHAAKPDTVKVEWGQEFPTKIRFSETDYGIRGTFMLAPRIMSDDDGTVVKSPSFDADLFTDPDEDGDDAEAEPEAVAA